MLPPVHPSSFATVQSYFSIAAVQTILLRGKAGHPTLPLGTNPGTMKERKWFNIKNEMLLFLVTHII